MRSLFSFLGGLILTMAPLLAQQSSLLLPSSWTVTQADSQGAFSGSDLNLPPGAQLVRSVASDDFALSFTSKLVIGESQDTWPVLEIGSTALVFFRTDSIGKLAVLVDGGPSVELPASYPLDSEGSSNASIPVTIVHDKSVVSILLDGQSLQFPLNLAGGTSTEVVFSAGAFATWAIKDLELNTGISGLAPVNQSDGKRSSGPLSSSASGKSLGKKVPLLDQVGDVTSQKTEPEITSGAAAATGNSLALEIFTPPAVRFGKAEAARLATAKLQNR